MTSTLTAHHTGTAALPPQPERRDALQQRTFQALAPDGAHFPARLTGTRQDFPVLSVTMHGTHASFEFSWQAIEHAAEAQGPDGPITLHI